MAGVSNSHSFFQKPELHGSNVYNMPFLLDASGKPWNEANSYLYYLGKNKQVMARATDDLRRRASRILSYKIFTEDAGLDWLNFDGKRAVSRPSYRYFIYLTEELALKPAVVNQYTGDVYKFYEFISKNWRHINMERVDKTSTIKIHYSGQYGHVTKEVQKRSQTKAVPRKSNDSVGYVVDEGDELRPLTIDQYAELKDIINGANWSPCERLIIWSSLWTGARKQTVLTMRYKDIKELALSKPDENGRHKLFAGPGTSIDTKNGKSQILYFPKQLIDELWVYANCKEAKDRRAKFRKVYKEKFPDLPPINNECDYLFLSNQGNCYYMAKDDPRYGIIKTRPIGQVVENLKRKIFKTCSDSFPRDFYYHWLRATHAYLLWLSLKKHVDDGSLAYSGVISFIQRRLHHKSRTTTENYLKLFQNIDIKFSAQEAYEDFIFGDYLIKGDDD